ncbi:MAG: OmpH family outer membrane protein [Bacteroidales bacterium]|nr:OmpH family outer membrane protein [Bacteroidales bacterium]MDD3200874.1 OmpH family outer membrane protein [Bacteroidales bacterium]
MKKTSLILSIAAIVISAAALVLLLVGPCKSKTHKSDATVEGTAAVAGDIVYIQIDTLILQYDMYNDLRSAFESKAQSIQDDLQKKGRKLESDGKAFENQLNKGLLTRSVAEQQQNALLQRQQELQNLANQKQQELQEEEYVLNNTVMDAIHTYLATYNEDHNFAMILTTSAATNSVIIGSSALDITQDIVNGLNEEYIKVRNKK